MKSALELLETFEALRRAVVQLPRGTVARDAVPGAVDGQEGDAKVPELDAAVPGQLHQLRGGAGLDVTVNLVELALGLDPLGCVMRSRAGRENKREGVNLSPRNKDLMRVSRTNEATPNC